MKCLSYQLKVCTSYGSTQSRNINTPSFLQFFSIRFLNTIRISEKSFCKVSILPCFGTRSVHQIYEIWQYKSFHVPVAVIQIEISSSRIKVETNLVTFPSSQSLPTASSLRILGNKSLLLSISSVPLPNHCKQLLKSTRNSHFF